MVKSAVPRREFLRQSLIGGTTAALTGCTGDPVEKLIPVLVPPEHYIPGKSIFYATSCRECTSGCGITVRTREGRAVKIEGNTKHPLSRGATCALGQSSLQGLYSPQRVMGPLLRKDGQSSFITWNRALTLLQDRLKAVSGKAGNRILYISPPETGTLSILIGEWLEAMGGGDWLQLDLSPVHSLRAANDITFGKPLVPWYDLEGVDTVINFGTDFLESWLNPVHFSRQYADLHGLKNGSKGRFIHISPHLSLTGCNADEWITCRPGTEYLVAGYLAYQVLLNTKKGKLPERKRLLQLLLPFSEKESLTGTGVSAESLQKLMHRLATGSCLVLSGGNTVTGDAGVKLHVAVNIINFLLGRTERQIQLDAGYRIGGDSYSGTARILNRLRNEAYGIVLINGVNPVYSLPNENIEAVLKNTKLFVSFSPEEDETSCLADLHLPTRHYLQEWGDNNPMNGIWNLQQPVISELPDMETRSTGDLILRLMQLSDSSLVQQPDYYSYLREHWRKQHAQQATQPEFESFWKESLSNGGLFKPLRPGKTSLSESLFTFDFTPDEDKRGSLTLIATNSNLHNVSGHAGNRYWMLEIPHPVSQIAWDSWVEIHPETAKNLKIRDGEYVEVITPYGKATVVAFLYYGVERKTIVMPAGLGRTIKFPAYKSRKGSMRFFPVLESRGDPALEEITVGVNVMKLLPAEPASLSGDFGFTVSGVTLRPTGIFGEIPAMDGQQRRSLHSGTDTLSDNLPDRSQKGRGFVQVMGRDSTGELHPVRHSPYVDNERTDRAADKKRSGFYSSVEESVNEVAHLTSKQVADYHQPYKWEMVIDLDRCTGCSACVVACYAENNIPVVGRERVIRGREMSWLRIERFIEWNPGAKKHEIYFTPQMCAQCDNAGCEPVCPVYATYQTPEGLNAMVYNRCVGSRYCSNNCIFKQRRFNWRTYAFPSPLHLQLNPDVTVREKGVMEKCTFCFQRIREQKENAKASGVSLDPKRIQTACQQVCPTGAITFGNAADASSDLVKGKSDVKRSYIQLPELNFRPAVTYLKKVNHDSRKA